MKKLLLLGVIMLIIISGCSKNSQAMKTSPDSSFLEVYTTVFPIYDFTQKIGGDRVKVHNMLPWGASPHSFEPSSRLMADLSKAGLIIYNGAGLEPYMDKLAAGLKDSGVTIVNSSQGIELIRLEKEHDNNHHSSHEHHHDHGLYDPHIWLSPKNADRQGENILNALINADPLNKEYYIKNYESFQEDLRELDGEYEEAISRCEKKEIVVAHEAFNYLCRDYGLTQISLMGPNAEAEPTPGKMRDLVEFIRAHKISHIFFEALESPKAAQAIASETNTQLLSLNPLGSITEKELEKGEDYFTIMKSNLTNLKKGLRYR